MTSAPYSMDAPYSFAQARAAAAAAARAQHASEQFTREAAVKLADAERAYRQALAAKITELRADGVSVTLAADLARGDKHVSDLRHARDVAEGVVEAARQAAWRHQADRRDTHELIRWAHGREVAEGQAMQPQWTARAA